MSASITARRLCAKAMQDYVAKGDPTRMPDAVVTFLRVIADDFGVDVNIDIAGVGRFAVEPTPEHKDEPK